MVVIFLKNSFFLSKKVSVFYKKASFNKWKLFLLERKIYFFQQKKEIKKVSLNLCLKNPLKSM